MAKTKKDSRKNPEKEWFGERHVTPDEKTGLVRGVFDSVADKYDLMNDLMSGGLHRLWKDRLIRQIRPRDGLAYLDVAGGTGDIAFRIKKAAPKSDITVFDLNPHMLEVGKDRAADRGHLDFEWVTGNAESLPFPDASFDVYTIAFGLRNVTRIDTALAEAVRVLKPGGRFFCLEFSPVQQPVFNKIYDLYSFHVIPKIGQMVTKDADSYRYLVESIRKFPHPKNLVRRMGDAGMTNAKYASLSGGIVAIHQGVAP
jgi:demethylmenaquinone methyltransferase / 2-methoxy-6-polyprenyl-1,4-benzoquinol methylase